MSIHLIRNRLNKLDILRGQIVNEKLYTRIHYALLNEFFYKIKNDLI